MRNALTLCLPREVKREAAITAIGAQRKVGLTCGHERIIFSTVSYLFGADALSRADR